MTVAEQTQKPCCANEPKYRRRNGYEIRWRRQNEARVGDKRQKNIGSTQQHPLGVMAETSGRVIRKVKRGSRVYISDVDGTATASLPSNSSTRNRVLPLTAFGVSSSLADAGVCAEIVSGWMASWHGRGHRHNCLPLNSGCRKISSSENFQKRPNLGLKFRRKIEILSTHNLLYRKIATSCPAYLFQPTTPLCGLLTDDGHEG